MIQVVGPSRYKVNKKALRSYIKELVTKYSIDPEASLNVVFVGTRKMRDIASTYKHEDAALPVLAFPYNDGNAGNLLGEIFICYPAAVLLAAERQKKIEDMMKQLIDHGIRNILTGTSTPLIAG